MTATSTNVRNRVASIDVLRGIVMVIMAIDHCRDFFHIHGVTDDPTNMATTTPALFFTRWITHFCAPIFVFLSGTAAYLNGQKKTTAQLSGFLLKRGLWLILLEFVIVTLLLTFNPQYNLFILQVIWAIGISMVLLAALVYLPYRALLVIGLAILFFHNLLDVPEAIRKGNINLGWSIIHGRNAFIPLGKTHGIFMAYSFLPWTGLMILGYCTGKLFTQRISVSVRRKTLLRLGGGLLLLFVVLRLINVYGDPQPWSHQRMPMVTFLSFMNVNKYPPSLLYSCMTIGTALIVLALIEPVHNRITQFFSIYGRVPFFYYLLHFFLIHLICVAVFFAKGYPLSAAYGTQSPFGFRPPQFGFGLPVVYLVWLVVVLSLYPLCKMYNRYKSTHDNWWLSYL